MCLCGKHQPFRTPATAADKFNGYYPAIKEYVYKVRAACAKRNLFDASYWASKMQQELTETLAHVHAGFENLPLYIYDEYRQDFDQQRFPDLAQAVAAGDVDNILEQVQRFDARAQEYLTQNSISIRRILSFEELQTFMKQSW